MAKKAVKISATGADVDDIENFEWFQGELKTLSPDSYKKLKSAILELGFSEPLSVWLRGNDKVLLNGHQRILTLKRMREEGYKIPYVPYSIVEAENEEEAKRKVLSLASTFGTVTEEGLAAFVADTSIEISELTSDFELGPLDFGKLDALMDSPIGTEVSVSEHSRTIGADKKEEPPKEPRCKKGQVWILGENELTVGIPDECDFLIGRWETLTDQEAKLKNKPIVILKKAGKKKK